MNNKTLKNNKKGGYAILFTVAIVAVISMITIGLSNATYKQIILSSVARDSAKAFYEADIASECSLYFENNELYNTYTSGSSFSCGGHSLLYTMKPKVSNVTTYEFEPENYVASAKCFYSSVKKTEGEDYISTVIETRGYNICDANNIRTVERAIRVTY